MNLEQLLEKVPEEWKPIVRQYGPALLKMTAEEVWAWIDLLIADKSIEAFSVLAVKLDNAEFIAACVAALKEWPEANKANKDRMALQRQAMEAVLRVMLGVALAVVGL